MPISAANAVLVSRMFHDQDSSMSLLTGCWQAGGFFVHSTTMTPPTIFPIPQPYFS